MERYKIPMQNEIINFIIDLEFGVFERIINIIPYSEIINFLKKNPKSKPTVVKSFRVEKIPKGMLIEPFYKSIVSEDDNNLIIFIYKFIMTVLSSVKEKAKENEINLAKVLKNRNDLDNLIEILINTEFSSDIELYFILERIKLTKKAVMEINSITEFKKQVIDSEKKLKESIRKEFILKQSEIEKEKNNIITDLENEIKRLKNEVKEKELKKIAEINSLQKEIKQKEIAFNNQSKSIEKKIKSLENKLQNSNLVYEKKIKEENDKFNKLKKLYIEKENEVKELSYILDKESNILVKRLEEDFIEKNLILVEELKVKEIEIEELNIKSEEIKNEIQVLTNKKSQYEEDIFYLDNKLAENIKRVKNLIGDIGFKESKNNNVIYSVCKDVNCDDLHKIDNIRDFVDDLSDNLEIVGIERKFKANLSNYITSIIMSEIPMLLIGYSSRGIANAISMTMYGQAAEVLNLSQEITSCDSIINHINKSDNNVILIENVVDNFNENIYLSVVKEIKNKIIIFSVESSDNIQIINRSIFNYMIPVDIEYVCGLSRNEEMISSLIDSKILNVSEISLNYDEDIIFREYEDLNFMSRIVKQILNKVKFIMNDINKVEDEISFNILAQYTLYPLSKNKGKTKEFLERARSKRTQMYSFSEFIDYATKVCEDIE